MECFTRVCTRTIPLKGLQAPKSKTLRFPKQASSFSRCPLPTPIPTRRRRANQCSNAGEQTNAAAEAASDEGAPPHAPSPRPLPPPRPLSLASALPFWFYLAAAISLVALLLPHLLPPSSPAPLPPLLRGHLAFGSVLKLDPAPGLFAVTSRPAAAGGSPAHRVLILPSLAAGSFSFRRVLSSLSSRGALAAALDLPGQGLSPTPLAAPAPSQTSALREIMDRGIFHAFENLVQTGEVPYQEEPAASPAPSPHAAASANPGVVRSVTLVDAAASLPAFPAAVFDVPVLGRLVLRVPALFRGLVWLCCARGMGAEEAEAHRAAMRGRGGHMG